MIALLFLERFEKVFEAQKNFKILKIEGELGKLSGNVSAERQFCEK